MINNVYDMFYRLGESHGHLWTEESCIGQDPISGVEEAHAILAQATDPVAARGACVKLSGIVECAVKGLPAPHDSGVLFDPEDVSHTTETGREHWGVISDTELVYQIWRPGSSVGSDRPEMVVEVVFFLGLFPHTPEFVSVRVNEVTSEWMRPYHWEILWGTFVDLLTTPDELKRAFGSITDYLMEWKA